MSLIKDVDIYPHVVCEYADGVYVEFVTAYIPNEVEWNYLPFKRRRNWKWKRHIKKQPKCAVHNVLKQWRRATFEYEENGISVRVPNIDAWVCPADGEASFTPEIDDEILITVRDLLESARRGRERRTVLTEYIVSVGERAA